MVQFTLLTKLRWRDRPVMQLWNSWQLYLSSFPSPFNSISLQLQLQPQKVAKLHNSETAHYIGLKPSTTCQSIKRTVMFL